MKRALLCAALALCLANAATRKPKLIVAIVIDQFRYDYLTRFGAEYTGGLKKLVTGGAVFTNARYIHVPTVTAVGHSTFLSGAIPSISGIVGNEWFDADGTGRVTSVSDASTKLVGGKEGTGSSPHRLLVSTVGDELKMANGGKSKVVGVSLKDRSAILPGGHTADGAYWFDSTTGNFVSSTYYMKQLPDWATAFNARHASDQLKGKVWFGHTLSNDPAKLYTELESTPYGNDLVAAFAESALTATGLGKGAGIDLLSVSFSSNDYIGHEFGFESPEAHDVSLKTDLLIGKLLAVAEKQAGPGNVLVVLTADHGAPPIPEKNLERKMPGGRIDPVQIKKVVQDALAAKYGAGEWVAGVIDQAVYLNRLLAAQKKLNLPDVRREAARVIEAMPHVARVYTMDSVMKGEMLPDEITKLVVNGWNPRRSPDVELIPEPYWMVKGLGKGQTHGTPYGYDSHVPVIFFGTGIKPGRYDGAIAVNDIAPTLATMLEIETPSGSVGRVLTEMLVQ